MEKSCPFRSGLADCVSGWDYVVIEIAGGMCTYYLKLVK